jgi:ubiquinone/menaquinone biosynthesis C-methylase UbiE
VENFLRTLGIGHDIRNKTVLDLGCGTGGILVALGLKGAYAIGVEPSISSCRAALLRSNKYPIKSYICCAIGENLPFKDETFDAATAISVIEHVKDKNAVLSEAYRVTKKGGTLFFWGPNNVWPREEHFRIFWPPLLPKKMGKIYLRLRGKNYSELENISYIIPCKIEKTLAEIGYSKP